MQIGFTIPGPPEGKRRPRTRVMKGRAVIYTDPADKKAEKRIADIVRPIMAERAPFVGPVQMQIDAIFEPPASWSKKRRALALEGEFHVSRPDYDNIAKLCGDALNPDENGPWCLTDDSQVALAVVRKRYGTPARVEVMIEDL